MRKTISTLVIAMSLAACAPTAGPQPTASIALNFPTTSSGDTSEPGVMECVVVAEDSAAETDAGEQTEESSFFPPPAEDDWSLGPEDAAVTFIEYTDYQAEASQALDLNLARLVEAYPGRVRRVFRHFPLPYNDKSGLAAAAAEAAGAQGKFWEMSGLLTEQWAEWSVLTHEDFYAWLVVQAGELGLDTTAFEAALADPALQQKLLEDQKFGLDSGIPTMPWLLVNGEIYQGPRDYRSLENLVGLELLKEKQYRDCPPFVISQQKQYFARLETAHGTITLQLDPLSAPLAVNSFVYLAREGWYDGVSFHRVIPGYVAQTGDPSGTGFGGPGYAFRDDVNNLRFERAGVVAMVNSGPDSNGSQFFITFQAVPELDGQYVVFGQVIEGLDVLSRLTPRDPSLPDELPVGDVIDKATIEER